MENQNKVVAEIDPAIREKMELQNKRKHAVDKLKELRNLFRYLENCHSKNRQERKQFKRDFISDDDFAQAIVDKVVQFYEAGVKSSEESDNIRRGT